MLFDRFLLAVESRDLSQTDKILEIKFFGQAEFFGKQFFSEKTFVHLGLRLKLSANWFLSILSDLPLTRETETNIYFFNFTKLQFLNDKIYSHAKKNYLALGNLILQDFSQFFWWEVNWEDWEHSFCRKFRPQLLRDRKKKFCYPSLQFGKEDTLIILLSAWDRSRDSTAKRNLSKDM